MKIRTGEIADKDKDKKIVSSVKLSKGTRVGTLKLTVNGEEQDSVPIRGLGGGSSTVIGGSVDTQALWDAINKKVDVDFFKNLFTVYDSSDIEIATNTYTRKPDNLKISVGTWTEEYLSALGKNSEGGGGGGGVGTVIGIALGTGTTPIYPDDDTGIVTLPAYPNKVSQLVNDSGFVTSSTLNNYVTSSYLANNFYTKAQADSKYMTIAAFESLFNALDSNGDKINHPYSSGVDSIKALVGLWTEEYLSALGQNSKGGGGGGTGDVSHIKISSNPDVFLDPVDGIIDMSSYAATWNAKANSATTLAGYGITDAKITNGTTITLGSNSITPLTANSSLAWNKLTGTPTTLAGYGIGDVNISNGVITLGSSTITPVTSVGLSAPTGFSVSGSPVTKTGTLTFAYASGYEGFTTSLKEKIEALYSWFEVDANGDVKTKDTAGGHVRGFYTESFVSALGKNSQGESSTFDENQMWEALGTNATTKVIATSHIPDMAYTYGYLKASALNGYATQTWVNQQGFVKSSGVTSVAMTVPTGLSVSGSPITSTGTFALTFANGYSIPTTAKQSNWDTAYGWGNHASAGYALASDVYSSSASRTANTVLAAPNGSAGAATFRALVAADIPSLAISKITNLQTTLDAKALKTTTISAGNGLTGGGDLSSNRTINVVSANAAITVNADNIQLNVINDYITTTNNTIIPLAAARGKDLNDRLAILESWFEADANGNIKTKDKPNNGGHRGFYTESFVSALGLNGEEGGMGDVSHIKIGTNPDVFLDPDEDGIIDMSSYAANWNDAYNKRHTHSNKSVLDGITSAKVSHWDAVYGVVPQAAYETGNQLADKNFVNSSISTATATYISNNGEPFNSLAELQAYTGQHDKNDYAFVKTTDSAGNTLYNRYKFDGTSWSLEYTLNNSSFTSDQWSAINSGITTSLVTKLNGIASGAQVNVIESVKVNGTALSISGKAVDITAVPFAIITGADDLKKIEGLSGTGFLKRTGNNDWALDTTVVLNTRKVSAGNGLQGGGDLSADRTLSILLPSNSGLSVASTGLKLDIVNNLTTESAYKAISATQAKKIWDLLNQMFTLEGAGTTASPYVIKANYGLYSEQFLSALGQNSSGGGSGDFSEEQMWAALQANTGTYENAKINWNHIPLATTSTAGAIKVGSTLAISNGILNQATIPNLTADVYTKVTVDTYGRVTQGGDLLADDIPTLSMSKISGLSTALGNVYTKTESDGKYITALGTNGNYLTYTKNGNANNITVPYATSAGYILYKDTRNVADTPTSTNSYNGVRLDFKTSDNGTGEGGYSGVLTLDAYSDYTGGYPIQLGFKTAVDADDSKKIHIRTPKNADTWNAWRTILDSSNTYVTNGKGYINGAEVTTASKLGTSTVGNDTTPIYLNNGAPIASNIGFVKNGDVLQTTNPFSPLKPRSVYISKIDNALYAAEKRFTVTGELTDGNTSTEVSAGTLAQIFNGDYESSYELSDGKTLIIHIRFDGYSDSIFPGYPQGDIYLSFYYVAKPSSVTARCYSKYTSSVGWHNMTVTNLSSGEQTFLYKVRNDYSSIEEFEFTIVGDTSNSYGHTRLSQIEMKLDRPHPLRTPFLTKYGAETLHYPLTLESNLRLNNNTDIFVKDTSGALRQALIFASDNTLHLGYGTAHAGYSTYIDGYRIILRYGASHTEGLILDSSGNTNLAGNLYLGNHKAIYAKDSNGSNKRIAILQSNNILRFGIDTPEAQYQTFIDGYDVLLRYGTSHTTGLTLNNLGQVIIPSTGSLKIGGATLSWDSTNQMLKVDKGFYSDGAVSALGSNSEGGGSGAGLEDVWDSLTNQQGTVITDNTKIAVAHIPDTSSTYGYLKSSALSGYATQAWVNQQGFLTTHQTLYTLSIYGGTTKVLDFKPNANASIYIKAGGDISLTNDTTNKYITLSYTHPTNGANTTISAANGKVLSAITVNSLGHVTSVSSKTLAASDIPDLSSTYATDARADTLEGYFNTGGVAKVAAKLNTGTTTYTAWGQTYWSSGVPQSISGNMTSVGSITPSANGNALGTTSARFNIYGTGGNFSSNVSITGTLGVTGAATLSSSLSVASGITLTTTKKIYFGDTSHYIELTSTGFHFSHGIYSDSFVSALGANSSGGSSTFDEDSMWAALDATNEVIGSAHIPNLSWNKITSNKPTTLSGYGITNAYTKTQVDNALSGYLPLSGGTITLSSIDGLTINKSSNAAGMIRFTNGSTLLGYLGYYGTENPACNVGGTYYSLVHAGNYDSVIGNSYIRRKTYTLNSSKAVRITFNNVNGGIINVRTTLSGASLILVGNGYGDEGTTRNNWVQISKSTSYFSWCIPTASGIGKSVEIYNSSSNSASVVVASFDTGVTFTELSALSTTASTVRVAYASDYLPLTGGTLTGGLGIKFDTDTSREMGYSWLNTSGTRVASITYHNTAQNIILNPVGSANTYSDAVGKYSLIVGNNSLTYNTYPILHSNNYSSYALPLSGGTMSGPLKWVSASLPQTTTPGFLLTIDSFADGGTTKWALLSNVLVGKATADANGNNIASTYLTAIGRSGDYITQTKGGTTSNVAHILERPETGNFTTSGSGWYRVAQFANSGAHGNSVLLYLNRTFNHANNESFIFAITTMYSGLVNITRLAGTYNSQYFTKIRVDNPNSGYGYIDVYYAGGTNENDVHITTIGSAYTLSSFTLNPTTVGTLTEFSVANMPGMEAKNLTVINAASNTANDAMVYFENKSSDDWAMRIECGTYGYGLKITATASNALEVYGTIYASSEITAASDERAKNVLGDANLDLRYIADAPNVLYEWKDASIHGKGIHGGSLAQYWLKDERSQFFVSQDKDSGMYSLNYGALGTSLAISVAKYVVKHEDEITRLKKEVVKLRERVAELEERRIA